MSDEKPPDNNMPQGDDDLDAPSPDDAVDATPDANAPPIAEVTPAPDPDQEVLDPVNPTIATEETQIKHFIVGVWKLLIYVVLPHILLFTLMVEVSIILTEFLSNRLKPDVIPTFLGLLNMGFTFIPALIAVVDLIIGLLIFLNEKTQIDLPSYGIDIKSIVRNIVVVVKITNFIGIALVIILGLIAVQPFHNILKSPENSNIVQASEVTEEPTSIDIEDIAATPISGTIIIESVLSSLTPKIPPTETETPTLTPTETPTAQQPEERELSPTDAEIPEPEDTGIPSDTTLSEPTLTLEPTTLPLPTATIYKNCFYDVVARGGLRLREKPATKINEEDVPFSRTAREGAIVVVVRQTTGEEVWFEVEFQNDEGWMKQLNPITGDEMLIPLESDCPQYLRTVDLYEIIPTPIPIAGRATIIPNTPEPFNEPPTVFVVMSNNDPTREPETDVPDAMSDTPIETPTTEPPTAIATETESATPPSTKTIYPTDTSGVTPSATESPTATTIHIWTSTPTATLTPTLTVTDTFTPSITPTRTPTKTLTPTPYHQTIRVDIVLEAYQVYRARVYMYDATNGVEIELIERLEVKFTLMDHERQHIHTPRPEQVNFYCMWGGDGECETPTSGEVTYLNQSIFLSVEAKWELQTTPARKILNLTDTDSDGWIDEFDDCDNIPGDESSGCPNPMPTVSTSVPQLTATDDVPQVTITDMTQTTVSPDVTETAAIHTPSPTVSVTNLPDPTTASPVQITAIIRATTTPKPTVTPLTIEPTTAVPIDSDHDEWNDLNDHCPNESANAGQGGCPGPLIPTFTPPTVHDDQEICRVDDDDCSDSG